jgi:hypothetical protein
MSYAKHPIYGAKFFRVLFEKKNRVLVFCLSADD